MQPKWSFVLRPLPAIVDKAGRRGRRGGGRGEGGKGGGERGEEPETKTSKFVMFFQDDRESSLL